MENSIEQIWKQGFLNESSLVAPQVNDLYNQKSIQVVDRIKRKIKNLRTFALVVALFVPIGYYFVGAFWQGLAFSAMVFFLNWYTKGIISPITTFDQGATSYAYLKSFDKSFKDIIIIDRKIARYSIPLYVLIANIATWSAWSKMGIIEILQHRHPSINIALFIQTVLFVYTLLTALFSVTIHKWAVRAWYGRLLNKLEETIAEMEKLKQGE